MSKLSVVLVVFLLSILFSPVWVLAQSGQPFQNLQNQNSTALMDKAKRDGWVRVIVKLDIPTTPEGYLSAQTHLTKQRQLIASKQSALLNRLQANTIRKLKRFKYVPLVSMMVSERNLQALLAATEVAAIVEDAMLFPSLAQSIPLIGVDDAHADGFSGQNQTIAILDTGVDSNHPFLTGKIVSEACFSTTDPAFNIESTCLNGQSSQIGPGSGAPCQGGGCDHGTHVAGIAAGGNSGFNFSGVAKGASIIAIQTGSLINDAGICGSIGLATPCVIFYSSDLISAGEHVYSLRDSFNIAAVNLSLGGQSYTSPCDSQAPDEKIIIDLLRSVGIATIASSGNEGFADAITSPACISSAISVGATDKSDQVPSFSNSASFLDLLAPGVDITSSIPGPGLGSKIGTSMAAPHVTGAFAVLRSKNPSATVDEILAALKNTGQLILDTRNGIEKLRIQVDLALTQIPSIHNNDVVLNLPNPGVTVLLNDNSSSAVLHADTAEAIAVADVDNNEEDDVIVSFPAGTGPDSNGGTYISRNQGALTLLDSKTAELIVTGNFDGNLGEDLLLDFGIDGLWIYLNDSSLFNITPASPLSMVAGDVDNNGMDDVVLSFTGVGTVVLKNLFNAFEILDSSPAEVLEMGDFDGNGEEDIMAGFAPGNGPGGTGGLFFSLNQGALFMLTSLQVQRMTSGDFDGSGQDDLLLDFGAATGQVLFLNASNAVFFNNLPFVAMTSGDVDSSGQDDMILSITGIGTIVFKNLTTVEFLDPGVALNLATGNVDGN